MVWRECLQRDRAGPVRITEMAPNLQQSERSGQMVMHRGSSGRRQFEQDRDKMAPKSTEALHILYAHYVLSLALHIVHSSLIWALVSAVSA